MKKKSVCCFRNSLAGFRNCFVLFILILTVCALATIVSFANEDMTGVIEQTGTSFQVNDSDYINLSLDSNVEISAMISSLSGVIMLQVDNSAENSNISSSDFILKGFPANSTFYKYEDTLKNYVTMLFDENGSFFFIQNISGSHLIFIMPSKSTYFLNDVDGGNCGSFGTWDSDNKTCYVTQDVGTTVEIDSNGLTIDCQGHSITGISGFGVYVPQKNNIGIKNCNINGFKYGVMLYNSQNSVVTSNNIFNVIMGMWVNMGGSNNIESNFVRFSATSGIWLRSSNMNTVLSNRVENFNEGGIYLSGCDQTLVKQNNVGNVSTPGGGPGIYILRSTNTKVIDNEVYDISPASLYGIGISVTDSDTTNVSLNTFTNNGEAIEVWNSMNTVVYLNNIVNSYVYQAMLSGGTNNLFSVQDLGGNYWTDADVTDINNDGFADAPYVFDGGQDDLPWTIMNGWQVGSNNSNNNGGNNSNESNNAVCGNGILEFGEQCDDGNSDNNDNCNNDCICLTCQQSFNSTGVQITEPEAGIYNYVFTDANLGISTIEILGTTSLIDLIDFSYQYGISEDGGKYAYIDNLYFSDTTKTVTIEYGDYVCALNRDDAVIGNTSYCFEDNERIVWSDEFDNKCDQLNVLVVAVDKDGNELPQFTCEMIEINGVYYNKVSGLSHSLVVSTNTTPVTDKDGDGYTSDVDCNDNNPNIHPGANDSNCDGIDNNCNGQIDESYFPTQTVCGIGACTNAGELVCQYGMTINTCQSGQPKTEICNNVDDDCNGIVDNIKPTPTTCGIGICSRTGSLMCQNGTMIDTCYPGQPTTEICNSVDSDCDGTINDVDSDYDGVNDCASDKCLETVPWYAEQKLNPNHYDSSNMNLQATYGCSCAQILSHKPGNNSGEYKHGCSQGTINTWIAQTDWAQN